MQECSAAAPHRASAMCPRPPVAGRIVQEFGAIGRARGECRRGGRCPRGDRARHGPLSDVRLRPCWVAAGAGRRRSARSSGELCGAAAGGTAVPMARPRHERPARLHDPRRAARTHAATRLESRLDRQGPARARRPAGRRRVERALGRAASRRGRRARLSPTSTRASLLRGRRAGSRGRGPRGARACRPARDPTGVDRRVDLQARRRSPAGPRPRPTSTRICICTPDHASAPRTFAPGPPPSRRPSASRVGPSRRA